MRRILTNSRLIWMMSIQLTGCWRPTYICATGKREAGKGRKSEPETRSASRGVALVLALIMLSVLVILVAQFQYSANVDARIAENYAIDRENYYAARGALNLANALLIKDAGGDQIDSFADQWADIDALKNFPIGGVSTVTEIKDQERFLNINGLYKSGKVGDPNDPVYRNYLWTKDSLTNLIRILGLEAELAERIADWIDEDKVGEHEEGARNKPLTTIEEMLQIPGVTNSILYGYTDEDGEEHPGLASCITLWGGLSEVTVGKEKIYIYKININTAPPEVLHAIIHIDDPEIVSNHVHDIVNYREEKYSEGNHPFNSTNGLKNVPGLSDIFTRDKQLASHLTVKSTFFEVSIEATKGYMKMRVKAIVQRAKDEQRKNIIRQYFWKERQAAYGLPSFATDIA